MLRCTRREFLETAGAGVAALALAPLTARAAEAKPAGFTLPPLPYAYDALEPYIDAETMKIHHDKHHAGYVKNLNAACAKHPELFKKSVEELMGSLKDVPMDVRTAVRNNGGGHANHSLFWTVMGPKKGGEPKGELAKAINAAFGSFDKFKTRMSTAANTQFGSGWGWLATTAGGKLRVVASANQDDPYIIRLTPILGVDVWEHAYYLKYKNLRPEYVKQWWNVVNWDEVARRYNERKKG